jgi:hypothetical protein
MIIIGILFLIMISCVISIRNGESYDTDLQVLILIGTITLTLGLLAALIIPAHIGTDYKIQNAQLERQAIVKELELIQSDTEDISKQKVYEDVKEWNKEVLKQKAFANNCFTNIFVNKKVADSMEIIEIK